MIRLKNYVRKREDNVFEVFGLKCEHIAFCDVNEKPGTCCIDDLWHASVDLLEID